MKSLAAAAASGRPKTGAATKRCPAFACAAASRSDNATLIVLMETWIAPVPKLPRMPLVAEHDGFDGSVVRQHRDDGIAPAGVRHLRGGARTALDKRPRLARSIDCRPVTS